MTGEQTLSDAVLAVNDYHRYFLINGEDDSVPGISSSILEMAGDLQGKNAPPQALSTHLINAATTGLTAYVYDRVVREGGVADVQEARYLVLALAAHDANKFVSESPDIESGDLDTSENSLDVLNRFFEADPFGLKSYLPDESDARKEALMDIKWLVQRTETGDVSEQTKGRSTGRVRGLERYCRMGDGFASVAHREGAEAAAEWLTDFYPEDERHVHVETFSPIQQPILNSIIDTAVKAAISGHAVDGFHNEAESDIELQSHGIVIGSETDTILYLGEEFDRDALKETVIDLIKEHVTPENYEFDVKANWQSFAPKSLDKVGIPFEKKRELIAAGYVEALESGNGGVQEFENIDPEFVDFLPELTWVVYGLKNKWEVIEEYDALQALRETVDESDDYNSQTRKIGFYVELYRAFQDVSDDVDSTDVVAGLDALQADYRTQMKEELTPEASPIDAAVEKFFATSPIVDYQDDIDADRMCFLCGAPADQDYQFGNRAFYNTQSFSRRVPPNGEYKNICPTCVLEHELVMDKVSDVKRANWASTDVEIAFVYYDDFVAGLNFNTPPSRDVRMSDDEDPGAFDTEDSELMIGALDPQYHIQPMVYGGKNDKLGNVRELLDNAVDYGAKVVIGKPFSAFRPDDALFVDHNAVRLQRMFGADSASSYAEVQRIQGFFALLRGAYTGSDYDYYIQVNSDDYVEVASYIGQDEALASYTMPHSDERLWDFADRYYTTHPTEQSKHMKMKAVAREGLSFYGTHYDSKHKKTKIFRTALRATLDGLNRDKDDDELAEYVAGQVYDAAKREEYAGYTTATDAEVFVEAVFDFLREDESFSKSGLSTRLNELVNTYHFAYDLVLDEDEADSDE